MKDCTVVALSENDAKELHRMDVAQQLPCINILHRYCIA
jgi:hypothetical protein